MPETRLQIELDDLALAEFDELAKLGDCRTRKEVFNVAITLLKWAAKQRALGYSIVSMNEKERVYKELEMPFLERVEANSRRSQEVRPGLPIK